MSSTNSTPLALLPPRTLERRRVQDEQRVLLLFDPEQQPIYQRNDRRFVHQRLERGVQLVAAGHPAQHHLALARLVDQLHGPAVAVDAIVNRIVELFEASELVSASVGRCDFRTQQLLGGARFVQKVSHLGDANRAQVDRPFDGIVNALDALRATEFLRKIVVGWAIMRNM